MKTTTFQTVDVKIPGTSRLFQAMMPRPVAPRNIPQEIDDYRVVTPEGHTTWWKNGTVERELPDGTHYIWNPPPTFAEAVRHVPESRAFFRFHPNGAIEATMYGSSYYYSPPYEAEQPIINLVELQVLDDHGEWMWYQLCPGGCGHGGGNCMCVCGGCGEYEPNCECVENMLLGDLGNPQCECGREVDGDLFCPDCEERCERCNHVKHKMIACTCYDDFPEALPEWVKYNL